MDAIRIESLTKRFGRTTAVDDLTLNVPDGSVFGFLGPNGAGKTTTIRLILGLLRPTTGKTVVLGRDASRETVAIHRDIAYVPGDFSTWPWLTGGESLELLARLHGSVDRSYRDELVRRFEFDPDKKGRTYSTGNKQKIAVIAAFASRAKLMILDEPTAGLDPLMNALYRNCVETAREAGQTIFLSSHILSEVEALCDRIAILRRGRLVDAGQLDEMRHLAKKSIDITFEGTPPDLSAVECVTRVEIVGHVAKCEVRGDVSDLIRAIAMHDVTDIDSREASLEEVFLEHYQPDAC